jgi:hypothetical protein
MRIVPFTWFNTLILIADCSVYLIWTPILTTTFCDWNWAHSGCIRSTGDAYASKAPGPISDIYRCLCLHILWCVFPAWLMRLIIVLYSWRTILKWFIFFAGKPTKPVITGPINVTENNDIILTCSSKSTSRPSYYAKTVSLNYAWYINNTVIESETNTTLRFPKASKDIRFNKFSCLAMESIESERSEEIRVNVWCEYCVNKNFDIDMKICMHRDVFKIFKVFDFRMNNKYVNMCWANGHFIM